MDYKTCSKCNENLSINNFIKSHAKCKKCFAEHRKTLPSYKKYNIIRNKNERTTEPQKCISCNQIKEPSEFYKNKNKTNGLSSKCKKCNNEETYNRRHTCERTTEPQKCEKCNIIKSASEFNTYASSKNGLFKYCKKCETLIKNEYKYKSINNFLKILYYSSKGNSKTRSKKTDFSISFDEWINIYNNQQGKCALTGIEMTISQENNNYNISPDRIDSDKGYTKDNIQFVCVEINIAKQEHTNTEFIEMCRRVANFNTPT
jgi:hypothetical protein